MKGLAAATLPDVQAQPDDRGLALDEVGVDQLAYPVTVVQVDGTSQETVAEAELVAALQADVRGTHMSRFVEVLEDNHARIAPGTPLQMARELRKRLAASSARVDLRFPLFFERAAPVSRTKARMRLGCSFGGSSVSGAERVRLGVRVPITSLCPCSKEISDYGAHSQRGHVDLEVELAPLIQDVPMIWPEDLLRVVDGAASAPVYPLLKRVDERHVTMQAYDSPAFVEDVARAIGMALCADPRVLAFNVAVANEESIHDHRAVARLRWSRS